MSKGRIISVLVSILAVLYVAGSLIALYTCRQALEREKERIYSIADHLELWKKITVEHNGYLDPEKLANDPRNIKITRIEKLFLTDDEDKSYVMYHGNLDEQRRKALKRKYFSDLVLDSYFHVVTDKHGKIKEMGWGKP
ncbi:MAG: hypothetical protein LGR52_05950 [Candidatus Thiosymbion ectosymbiont of Robbea hypermnestra]|nr:hypothetical protein [Candidatus Thiosymbion ectosymbiont of Robbea hypermnestra]